LTRELGRKGSNGTAMGGNRMKTNTTNIAH
jgi:hypothetical protein